MAGAPKPAAGGRYEIAAADPHADRQTILDLAGHLPNDPGIERYAKYYDRNPSGPPVVYLARERDGDQVVGMAAMMMSSLSIGGEPARVAVSGDFSILPDHRGLGPALALQRTVLADLSERGLICALGCPNAFSLPIVKRVGYTNVGELTRHAKLLKTRLVIDRFVSRRWAARILSALATVTVDPVLRLVSRESRTRRSRSLSIDTPSEFDSRFEDLWAAHAREHQITGDRRAGLLNWRYDLRTTGQSRYSIFAAVDEHDRVAAYLVYKTRNEIRHVFDAVCRDSSPGAFEVLIAEFLRDARRERAVGISFSCLGLPDSLAGRLRAFGFVARHEGVCLHVYRPDEDPGTVPLTDASAWYFVMGDSDLE